MSDAYPIFDQPALPEADRPVVRRPGSKEVATLEVRGTLYTNWTSVRIEQRYAEAFPTFQFDCTEESPLPVRPSALQFVPGDVVRAYIGGVPVLFGYITERHVAYDARNHVIRLIGVGDTFDLTNSSVPLDKLSGNDGKGFTQLAKDLAQHLNIQIHNRGAVDNKPFENIHIQPGETIMGALERYARMRNIVIGSRANGGLLAIGEHSAAPSGDLVEGYNILSANAVIRDQRVYKKIFAIGQGIGSNQSHGDQQNKQIAMLYGTSTRNRHQVVVADLADSQHGLQRRVKMEKVFTEGSKIEAQVVCQGWFKDNNKSEQIWYAGEYYTVDSPSLILNGDVLGCAGCVYEQDAGGTRTTLQLVMPEHMNGLLNFRQEAQQAERERVARENERLPAANPPADI